MFIITWRIYNQVGIEIDSSIGSEFYIGFRSGTSRKYTVFDLGVNTELKLKEEPLIIMDITLFKDLKYYNEQIPKIIQRCKFYGIPLTLLYHNNYVVTESQQNEYEKLVKSLVE